MLVATLQLLDKPKDIQRKISIAIAQEMNAAFSAAKEEILANVKLLIFGRIQNSDAVRSLMGGELQGEMGLFDPEGVLMPILRKWMDSLTIDTIAFRTVAGVPTGGFSLSFIEADWQDVLSMPEASYVSYNRSRGTATPIPWLEWLLEAGSEILVRDWEVSFHEMDVVRGHSRSGIAVMVESMGGYWQVPVEFRGVASDNFVLRALEGIDAEIRVIIQEAVYKRLAA